MEVKQGESRILRRGMPRLYVRDFRRTRAGLPGCGSAQRRTAVPHKTRTGEAPVPPATSAYNPIHTGGFFFQCLHPLLLVTCLAPWANFVKAISRNRGCATAA